MTELTKEIVHETLTQLRNKYNSYLLDDQTINDFTEFIWQDRDGNVREQQEIQHYLSYKTEDFSRTIVKEYEKIIITKNGNGRYYICHNRTHGSYPIMDFFVGDSHADEVKQMVFDVAEKFNEILTRGYTEGQIEFPTGDIIFANFFHDSKLEDYAFEVPDDLKYKEMNSINHSLGEQNTMKILSETHGLGYVQLGNRSVTIYKVNDDKIVITSSFLDYYDEETDEEIEVGLPEIEGWENLGEISCDVWRVEFIDKENFDKGDTLPLDHERYDFNKPFTGKVNPGKWNIKNHYHFMDDQIELKKGNVPIWVEMTRITE